MTANSSQPVTAAILGFLDAFDDASVAGLINKDLMIEAARVRLLVEAEATTSEVWPVGMKVRNVTGDYRIAGEVCGVVFTPEGRIRIVVAHRADGGTFLHIYGPGNLAPIKDTPDALPL